MSIDARRSRVTLAINEKLNLDPGKKRLNMSGRLLPTLNPKIALPSAQCGTLLKFDPVDPPES